MDLVRISLCCCFVLFAFISCSEGRPGSAGESRLREKILNKHDRIVRPSTSPDFNVDFSVSFNSLENVDDKERTITVQTWVVMKWSDTFIKWNKSDYESVGRIHFLPSEIWFPDIALYNNADKKLQVAGSTHKFLSNVVCNYRGECVWSGSAIFTASCDIDITNWPFDNQTCEFRFGSSSYDSEMLQLTSSSESKGSVFEGDDSWKVESLEMVINETSHGHCCPYSFSEIKYTVVIKRLSRYQIFYIFGPCCILTLLSLLSFCIPSESGERIGFVTTLLLSLMVYLLVVPDSLPASSVEIPILGIIIMMTLVIISFVLLSTIAVLVCFFRTDEPPQWLRCLVSKKPLSTRPINVLQIDAEVKDQISMNAVKPAFGDKEESPRKSSAFEQADTTVTQHNAWQEISFKLDKIFFCFYFLVGAIGYMAVIIPALV